jgi:hypothetical protein
MSVEAYIDVARLMFLWNLIGLPFWTVYNRLAIRAITNVRLNGKHHGPIAVMYETALKYGLGGRVNEMLDTGCLPSKENWRKTVKQLVCYMYSHKWKLMCSLYSSLTLTVQLSTRIEISIWWKLCRRNARLRKQCSLMIKLLTGNHSLNSGKYRHVVNTSLCQLCNSFQAESLCHMLFQCEGLNSTRSELVVKMTDAMPAAMKLELQGMTDSDKTGFILTGMNCDAVIPEWYNIYTGILVYISGMYKKRGELLT